MEKILILGSTGFIGSELVKKLEKNEKYKLFLPTRGENFIKNIENIIKINKPTIIINAIGIIKEVKKGDFDKIHNQLIKRVLSISKNSSVKKIIQISALGVDKETKSEYFKTKRLAEDIIKRSNLTYTIIRPSIVMGKGQKMFVDIKKMAKFLPFFISPKSSKVQPVHVEDLVKLLIFSIENPLSNNQIYTLCGEKIVDMGDIFKFGLKYLNIKRKVIKLPLFTLYFAIPFTLFLKNPPITLDQIEMLKLDSCCDEKEMNKVLKIVKSFRSPFKI